MRLFVVMTCLAGGLPGLLCGVAATTSAQSTESQSRAAIESPSLRQAIALRTAGKAEEALEELREGVRDVKQARGDGHPDLLPLYDLAAEILFETDQMEKAEPLLDKVVRIRERLIAEGDTAERGPLAASLLLLGKVHSSRGELEDVIDSVSRAVLLYGATYGPMHSDTLRANAEFTQAVELFDETLGADHEAAIHAREALAVSQEALGKYAAALESRRLLHNVKSSVYGDSDARTLREAQRLAEAGCYVGENRAGIDLLRRNIDAAMTGNATAAEMSESLRTLGRLQLASDEFSAASASFREAMAIDERSSTDPRHPRLLLDRVLAAGVIVRREGTTSAIVEELDSVGADLLTIDAFDEQLAYEGIEALIAATKVMLDAQLFDSAHVAAERAAQLSRELVLDPDEVTLQMVESQIALAKVGLAKGGGEAIRQIAENALTNMEQFAGPASWATLDLMVLVAECAMAQGDFGAAQDLLTYIFECDLPRLDYASEQRLANVVAAVAVAEPGESRKITDRYLAVRQRQFGEESKAVADAEVCLANAYQSRREWEAAVLHYERALAMQRRVLDPNHPEIAACLLPLSRAYRALRRPEEARDVLEQALAIWEAAVGSSHPVTLETVKALALSHLSLAEQSRAIPLMERLRDAYLEDKASDGEEVTRLLVRLAKLYAETGQREAAGECLNQAIDWGWWQMEPSTNTADEIFKAAVLVAELADIFQQLKEPAAARSAERRARSLASLLDDPQAANEAIDAVLQKQP